MAPVALEIPRRRGGWWHEYVCPAHGTRLLAARGAEFPCPHGCVLTGEPYAGAWAVLAHQAAARALRRLAVSGDVDGAVAGLCRYAELYRRLGAETRADAREWMLAGRLFQQALTEAIWATSLALAVQTLTGQVPIERLRPVAELLRSLRSGARDARVVLLDRDDFASNYTAWLNAAGAATSRALALLGEPDETATWVTGPHGVTEHLAAAVHPDGWEWEGSTYYHVFVLRAYLLALRGRPDLLEVSPRRRLVDMVAVVAALATDRDAVLPALHDTPYGDPGWDEELYELCLLATALPGTPDLGFLADPLAARLPPGIVEWRRAEARGWLGAGLPAEIVGWRRAEARDRLGAAPASHPGAAPAGRPAPERGSRLFPDAGYAVLAGNGYRAVLDLGPHGGSHGHLDKLALYVYGSSARWQPAYGVPPYGHPWRRDYYRTTAAHPTLTVDDAEQAEACGQLLYWRADERRAEVGAAAEVYPEVRFSRHVRAEPGWLLDVVSVAAERERRFILHLRADVDVGVRTGAELTTTHWPGDGGLTGYHVAWPPSAVLTVGPDLGPADDPQRTRPHPRWRADARAAVLASAYVPGGGVVTGLRIDRSGPRLLVHVESADAPPVRHSFPALS